MARTIDKICVIGAGVMGAGIAAQAANAGVPVLLLDLAAQGPDRDAAAKAAVARMLKAEPAPLMSPAAAKLIQTGNIDDHLDRVAECDWIVEAVVERLEIKQQLYGRLESVRRAGAAVSSNTSTIPLGQLVEGRSEAFKRHFLITHFFNPPRYMRLVEIVRGPDTDMETAKAVEGFIDQAMGKRLVAAKDTPGFIANRIGAYWLNVAVNAAMDLGLTVEEADQIGGRPMGVPKTGVFGLIDLAGVDLMPLLVNSLRATLPEGDAFFDTLRPTPLIDRMIAEGFTGRKGKGGFYRLEKDSGGRRAKLVLDLVSGEHRPERPPEPLPAAAERDLWALASLPDNAGAYARRILCRVLSYAATLAGEVADEVAAIDEAMKFGYNWRWGPFELIDRLGADRFADSLRVEGLPVPKVLELARGRPFYRVHQGRRQYLALDGQYKDIPTPEGVLRLDDIKLRAEPLLQNSSASLWDVGDGVVVLELTGKMCTVDQAVMSLIGEATSLVQARFKALVIYNDEANFSAGANLASALSAAKDGNLEEIERLGSSGQQTLKALKYAPFPVVGAAFGAALGGGCEILLHCDAIQAHAESGIGLVECSVGLLPAWGGNGEMLDRLAATPGMPQGPMPAVARAFGLISTARRSRSAAEARDLGYLRPSDGITMNRDRLLADAKAKVLSLVEGYHPPAKPVFRLPGAGGRAALAAIVHASRQTGLATEYDEVVAGRLASVLTGDDADLVDTLGEDQLLDLERETFLAAIADPRTQARIEHILSTGKPLRN